jgi:hypothetical protein
VEQQQQLQPLSVHYQAAAAAAAAGTVAVVPAAAAVCVEPAGAAAQSAQPAVEQASGWYSVQLVCCQAAGAQVQQS